MDIPVSMEDKNNSGIDNKDNDRTSSGIGTEDNDRTSSGIDNKDNDRTSSGIDNKDNDRTSSGIDNKDNDRTSSGIGTEDNDRTSSGIGTEDNDRTNSGIGSEDNAKSVEDKNQEEWEIENKFTGFAIPLYLQRYNAVKEILQKYKISKCVDFGCSECRVIDQYSQIETLSRLAFVDIDRTTLISNLHRLTPRLLHSSRTIQLTVEVYEGDITKYDERMKDFEAITLIEVIEHLIPEDLEMCSNIVFGQLHPKLVVITTPNSEFNTIFAMPEGKFRHWDHKFEWTREQFQSWCNGIGEMYGYNVEYSGVGDTNRISNLGYCSQIATFNSLRDISYDPNRKEEIYKFITKIPYPYMNDEAKNSYLMQSINFYLDKYAHDWFRANSEQDDGDEEINPEAPLAIHVPLTELMLYSGIWENCADINSLRKSLISAGYTLSSDGHSIVVEKKTNEWSDDESDEDILNDETEFGGGQFSDAEDDWTRNVFTRDFVVPCVEEQWN